MDRIDEIKLTLMGRYGEKPRGAEKEELLRELANLEGWNYDRGLDE